MDPYDSEKAARVWQRVHPVGTDGLTSETLTSLALLLRQQAAIYQRLSKQIPLRYNAALKNLSDQKRAQSACLRGIHILAIGPWREAPLPQLTNEPYLAALRRCYAAELQILTQFELYSADPAHGITFTALAAEQKAHCKMIPELIGYLSR